MVLQKRTEQTQKKTGEKPDYRGKVDVAAWVNTDKNGNEYLSVKIAGNYNLFPNRPKEEDLR